MPSKGSSKPPARLFVDTGSTETKTRNKAATTIARSYRDYRNRLNQGYKSNIVRNRSGYTNNAKYMPSKSRLYAVSKYTKRNMSKIDAIRFLNPFRLENQSDCIITENSIGNYLPVVSSSNYDLTTPTINGQYTYVILSHSNSSLSYITFTSVPIGAVSQLTYGTFSQAYSSPPDTLATSRLACTLRNVTKNQDVAGYVKFVSLSNYLEYVFDGTGTMKVTASFANSVYNIMNSNPNVKTISAQELTTSHLFTCAPASYVEFNNWNPYFAATTTALLEQALNQDNEKMQQTTLIFAFPVASTANSYNFSFMQQIRARYPSNQLLSNLSKKPVPNCKFADLSKVATEAVQTPVPASVAASSG